MPQIGEKLRHRQDEDQLYHSEGWKWLPPGILIQRLPQVFLPKINTPTREATPQYKTMDLFEQRLVVHSADGKHHPYAARTQ